LCEEWSGSGPVDYTAGMRWKVEVLEWDDKVFFYQIERDEAEKRWLFWASMQGNAEDCAKYKAVVTFKDREMTSLDTTMNASIVPMDVFFSLDDVKELGGYCSMTDNAMERVFFLGKHPNKDKIIFKVNIDIIKLR